MSKGSKGKTFGGRFLEMTVKKIIPETERLKGIQTNDGVKGI